MLLNSLKKLYFNRADYKKESYISFIFLHQGYLNPKIRGECRKAIRVGTTKSTNFIMENLGFHKTKLYSLILAGVAFISLLLPWISVSAGGFGGASKNGFGGWGLLVLLGIGAVAAACFMGNKALTFDDMGRKLVLGGFGAIAGGAAIYLIRIFTMGGGKYGGIVKVSPGLGLFLGLVAGAIGLLLLLGIIKVPKSIDDKVK